MAHNGLAQADIPGDLPILPHGWSYSPLSRLVTERGISYGIVQPGSHDPEGVPIVRVNNLKNGRIVIDDVLRVAPEIEDKYERTRLRGGEVLLSLVGSLGECAVVPNELAGWNVARAVGVVPALPEIGPRWIAFCLRSRTLQHYIRTWATTTVQATLNLRDVAKLPIPIPPQLERDAITTMLSSLDDKIELNRQMNETLEAIARTIFKSWFVVPVPIKVEGKESSSSWESSSLDQLAEFLNGLALQKFRPSGDAFLPVIKIAEMRKGSTEDADKASAALDPRYVVEDGDLLFSWSGSLEVRIWCGGRGALNQHLFKVTPASNYPKWFVYQWILEHLPTFQAIAAGKATTMGHIQRHHLREATVVVPPRALLQKADKLLRPVIDRLVHNNLESRTLGAVRDTLLPKLLSGEVRITDAERVKENQL